MILDKPEPLRMPERGCLWQLVPLLVPLYSNYCSSKPICATISCLLFCGSPWNVTWRSYTYCLTMQGASLAALTGGYGSWHVKYSHHLILIWPPYREFMKVFRVLLRQCHLDLENSSHAEFLFCPISVFSECQTFSQALLSGDLRLCQPVLEFRNKITG